MSDRERGQPEAGWELFPHGADIGLRGFGPTRDAAFEQAALALTGAVTDVATVEPKEEVTVTCEAPDDEMLLVEWLNALIFEMATRKMLFARFAVAIDGTGLRGQAWGEPVEIARHQPATEVKGATYTALKVARLPNGGWLAECVVDV